MAKCNCNVGQPQCGACVLRRGQVAKALPPKAEDWSAEIARLIVENRTEAKDYPCTCAPDGMSRCLRCVTTIAMRCYRAGQDHVITTVQDIRAQKGLN